MYETARKGGAFSNSTENSLKCVEEDALKRRMDRVDGRGGYTNGIFERGLDWFVVVVDDIMCEPWNERSWRDEDD